MDSELDGRLKRFMKENDISNQAKVIRKSVDSYLKYVNFINQNMSQKDGIRFKDIDNIIERSIKEYKTTKGFYEELKQNLSPLKTSILLMDEYPELPIETKENLKNIKKAVVKLEKSIYKRFEEPHPLRFENKFDLLHIEDNELDRKTIKAYFENKELVVNSVETTEEALEILKVATPTAILLDLNLKTSHLQGDEFCRLLKSKPEYREIPIVIMTALISKVKKHQFLKETSANEVIIKPINQLSDLDIILNLID